MSDRARDEAMPKAARKGRGGRAITTGIFLLPVVAVLLPSCIVLAVGMLPSMVAYVVDRTGGKYLTITVALLNFCGALPGLARLWQMGQDYGEAARLAADPLHWLASYGAASVGWLIYLVLPPILSVFYSGITARRIEGLKHAQGALLESWGPEVAPRERRGTTND